jgi:hypothetical protein
MGLLPAAILYSLRVFSSYWRYCMYPDEAVVALILLVIYSVILGLGGGD